MQFGVDKCKTHSINRGKTEYNFYTLDTGEQIEPMDEHTTYKYLGFRQSRQIQQKQTKLELTQKFKARISQILRTQLNSRNTIKAINTYAIPVLIYSFGILAWSQSDLIKLQRTINTHMTTNRKHHPRSCTQRLTLPRQDGGRGLIDIQNLHNNLIDKLRKYFYAQAGQSNLHKFLTDIDKKLTPLNLNDTNIQPKLLSKQQKIDLWAQKSLHGRHLADLSQTHVDRKASNEWLRRGELFPETEAFVIAIQDQVIDTLNYKKHIIRTPNLPTDLCRRCHSSSETIQHITGSCKSIVQTDYKHRHDQVAAIIHQNLAHKYSFISNKTAYYKYKPSTVLENNAFKIYWDRTIITDKTIHYNRPDITILDKTNKIVFIIDIAVCNTHNLLTTHTEKMTKYTDLATEIKRQWQVDRVKIVPIVISTTGVVPKILQDSLNTLEMPKSSLILLQKAVLLNTCRLTRKFLASSSSS
ncbi:unnamed protein product [Arctia plantaginis]|uniref:Reverse transcriptase domain-containing protein n=1 Tax=Arctia plantaginis TaxID=874455 RepID=A0A8S0ZKC1_ARCPL|nr:unnamed protein product [Arctia plantaginis]